MPPTLEDNLASLLAEAGLDVKSLTNFKALSSFNAAVARRASRRCNILWVGYSLAEGYPVLDYDKSPPKQLQSILRSRFNLTGGRGFVSIPTQGTTPALVSPIAISGGAVDPASIGGSEAFHLGAAHNCWYTNGAGQLTYTASSKSTRLDIHHVKGPSGSADAGQYIINGGTPVNFSTYDPVGMAATLQVTIPNGASVVIKRNSGGAAGYIIVTGVQEHGSDETSGIQVANAGHCGFTANSWSASASVIGGWRESWALLNPDLIVISDVGANDSNSAGVARTAVQYKADLIAWIAAIRAGATPLDTVPILIVSPYNTAAGITSVDPWSSYALAAREVVQADPSLIFLDLCKFMPKTLGNPKGLYNADLVHGANDGSAYEFMAQCVAKIIAPQADASRALSAVLFADNGDGTGTLTVDDANPFKLVDNGDGTASIALAGSALTVLTKPKPLYTPIGGQWYTPWSGGLTTFTMVLNTLYCWPMPMFAPMTIDDVKMEVTTVGAAGSTIRGGFYRSRGDGPDFVSGLLADLGTVDSASTGMKDWLIGGSGLTLPQEMLWFCAAAQGGTAPGIRTLSATEYPFMLPVPVGAVGSNVPNTGLQVSGVSGALPTTTQALANLPFTPYPARLFVHTK